MASKLNNLTLNGLSQKIAFSIDICQMHGKGILTQIINIIQMNWVFLRYNLFGWEKSTNLAVVHGPSNKIKSFKSLILFEGPYAMAKLVDFGTRKISVRVKGTKVARQSHLANQGSKEDAIHNKVTNHKISELITVNTNKLWFWQFFQNPYLIIKIYLFTFKFYSNDGTVSRPAIEFNRVSKSNVAVDMDFMRAKPLPHPNRLSDPIITEGVVKNFTSLDISSLNAFVCIYCIQQKSWKKWRIPIQVIYWSQKNITNVWNFYKIGKMCWLYNNWFIIVHFVLWTILYIWHNLATNAKKLFILSSLLYKISLTETAVHKKSVFLLLQGTARKETKKIFYQKTEN